ncbi:MAG: DUF177 domain-containing protein [Clostridia bacterium]|nr:DUF177 domain-containing protein [Clostridia bacterium]
MIIDLKKVFVNDNSSLPIEYELDMSSVDLRGVFPLKSPVKISGIISNRASIVVLKASISYTYTSPCDRCGIETSEEISVNIQKALAASIEGEESDSIIIVPDMKLDLDEFIYSEVVLSLPTKHLCSDNCKGICFKCGKNLNEGKCGCPEKEIDPRLSALAELLK